MSATGTQTPNIGLRIPLGTDPASVDDINYNSNLIDTKLGAVGNDSLQDQIDTLSTNMTQTLGKVQDGLAIVANGNTHVAIPANYFVYVKGHNSLSEGLYKNTSGSTIAANATLSTSNLTADDDGGLNSVYDALNSNITNLVEIGNWTPDIPRATFTVTNGKYCRVGNIVHLHAVLNITASQQANAYIDSSSLPAFGKTKSYATGSWMDNTTDKSGQLVSSGNLNVWVAYNGENHTMTDHVGHSILVSIIYSLY